MKCCRHQQLLDRRSQHRLVQRLKLDVGDRPNEWRRRHDQRHYGRNHPDDQRCCLRIYARRWRRHEFLTEKGQLEYQGVKRGLTLYGPASKPSLIISGDNSTVTVYNSPTDDETYITGSSVVIGASSAFSSHGNGNLKITGPRSIGKIHELSIDSDVAAPSTFIVDSCILLVYGALNLGGSPTDPKSGSTTSIINVINFNASLYNSAYPIAGDSDYFSCVTSLHNAVITVGGQCDQYFCKAALANSSVLGTHPNSAIHVLECGSLVLWPTFTHGKPTPGGWRSAEPFGSIVATTMPTAPLAQPAMEMRT